MRKLATHWEKTDVDIAFSFTLVGKMSLGVDPRHSYQGNRKRRHAEAHEHQHEPTEKSIVRATAKWAAIAVRAKHTAMERAPMSNGVLLPHLSMTSITKTVAPKVHRFVTIAHPQCSQRNVGALEDRGTATQDGAVASELLEPLQQ